MEASEKTRRSKYDLAKIAERSKTECPYCHHPITPAEYERTDGDHLRCSKCREQFIPKQANVRLALPASK